MNFVGIVTQVERQTLFSLHQGKGCRVYFPTLDFIRHLRIHTSSTIRQKFVKQGGFTDPVGCFLESSMLLALFPFLSYFCFLFLSAISYYICLQIPFFGGKKKHFVYFAVLPGSPPITRSNILPAFARGSCSGSQGLATTGKEPRFQLHPLALQPLPWAPCSYTGDQRSSPGLPQACVLSTYVDRKGRWPAEAELKSSSPSWLLTRTSQKRDGCCLYCYYCYKWGSGVCCVDNILLARCKQRRTFLADPCKLANISKNVKSS